jgi:hypothetical protein
MGSFPWPERHLARINPKTSLQELATAADNWLDRHTAAPRQGYCQNLGRNLVAHELRAPLYL